MKQRFILLDHSIEDTAGHYLEYARRVLRAATAMGLETVLVVNKRIGDIACPEAFRIIKGFTRTFWENQAVSATRRALALAMKPSVFDGRSAKSALFAGELSALFDEIGYKSDDIIFVPTLGMTELKAIGQYAACACLWGRNWHLLFRRDLPKPRSRLDLIRQVDFSRHKTEFLEAQKVLQRNIWHLYTDTETLSEQYNRLGVGPFVTLPVPVDYHLLPKKVWTSGPIVASYIGDAREEKGFHHLPDLISAVRSAGVSSDKVAFRVQGNIPAGYSLSRRRKVYSVVEKLRELGAAVYEYPLETDAYSEMIRTSDVILLPYDRSRYAARSSGVFVEALAVGVPCICPKGSWMDRAQDSLAVLRYNTARELPELLIRLFKNYLQYQDKAREYSSEWVWQHSADRLLEILCSNTERSAAIAAQSQ